MWRHAAQAWNLVSVCQVDFSQRAFSIRGDDDGFPCYRLFVVRGKKRDTAVELDLEISIQEGSIAPRFFANGLYWEK
jgi:hypothetical protein